MLKNLKTHKINFKFLSNMFFKYKNELILILIS
jgi:hypothetical protein